jgi:hypothetical protein
MNHTPRVVAIGVSFFCILGGFVALAAGQETGPTAPAVVQEIMTTALSRCYSTINGIRKITFEPPTEPELDQVKSLGEKAVGPLSGYLVLEPKNGLTQLLAVRFLLAIGGSSTFAPLKRAFGQDQWEVTRAAALAGMFSVSQDQAKPYVEAALKDKSQLVRQRAQDLMTSYH